MLYVNNVGRYAEISEKFKTLSYIYIGILLTVYTRTGDSRSHIVVMNTVGNFNEIKTFTLNIAMRLIK